MQKEFIEKLIETIDTEEELTLETVLKDLEEWDSLSFVSFIAMANADYGKKVSADLVRKAQTVGDLYKLIRD